MKVVSRPTLIRLGLLLIVGAALAYWAWLTMIRMPLQSYRGALPPLSPRETALRPLLSRDVQHLAETIGERNVFAPAGLGAAADFIERELAEAGQPIRRQTYQARQHDCHNLELEVQGTRLPDQIVVVGAHYDSVLHCPGANDNATGVAALLALARSLAGSSPARTIRFVAFVNEEPPFFQTAQMGSRVYAQQCRERQDQVVAMLSLETIGYYTDEPGSQQYPFPLGVCYPGEGNFIAFVGNFASRVLVRQCIRTFREQVQFPSEGAALPGFVPGVGWSDHWAFWKEGYPGLMVTDTAPFRYPHYHTAADLPGQVDYDRMSRVVAGLEIVIRDLANP